MHAYMDAHTYMCEPHKNLRVPKSLRVTHKNLRLAASTLCAPLAVARRAAGPPTGGGSAHPEIGVNLKRLLYIHVSFHLGIVSRDFKSSRIFDEYDRGGTL